MVHLKKGSARCSAALLVLALASGAGLLAQGPGGRPGGSGGPGRPGGGFPGDGHPGGSQPGSGSGAVPSTRNPLQHGPAGRWWDDTKNARTVGLTGDQQRRMDGVFADNRAALVSGLDTLRKAEARLSSVSATDHPSEGTLNAEIQNVAQARADLEKANTHMVLQIRNEMTVLQLNNLEKLK